MSRHGSAVELRLRPGQNLVGEVIPRRVSAANGGNGGQEGEIKNVQYSTQNRTFGMYEVGRSQNRRLYNMILINLSTKRKPSRLRRLTDKEVYVHESRSRVDDHLKVL